MNKFLQLILVMITLSTTPLFAKDNDSPINCKDWEKDIQLESPLLILDIRTPEEYASGYIPGAVNINFFDKDFISQVQQTAADVEKIALYCKSGRRSAQASEALRKKGYEVLELEGGITAWEAGGLPITIGEADIYITPEGKPIEIYPLMHASLRIKYDGKEIEIDPVEKMGDRITDYTKFPKADLILVTHEHYDHLDPRAIETLSKENTEVVANPNSIAILGFGNTMRNGDCLDIDGIKIEAVPAYNTSEERLQYHPKGRDNGYVLTLGNFKIYIAGDTEVITEMNDLRDIDIAFIPCNLPYTMTPAQLIEAAEIIKPKVVYPYHYGNTDLSDVIPSLAPEGIYVRICPFDPGAK